MRMIPFPISIMCLAMVLCSFSGDHGDAITGIWFNQEKTSKIKIVKMNEKYFGKIVWLKVTHDVKTGKPRTDIENPDESRRNEPLMNLTVLRRLKWDKGVDYSDGLIYDPKNGKEYSCKAHLKDKNHMELRGYIGISLLGRTAVWERAE